MKLSTYDTSGVLRALARPRLYDFGSIYRPPRPATRLDPWERAIPVRWDLMFRANVAAKPSYAASWRTLHNMVRRLDTIPARSTFGMSIGDLAPHNVLMLATTTGMVIDDAVSYRPLWRHARTLQTSVGESTAFALEASFMVEDGPAVDAFGVLRAAVADLAALARQSIGLSAVVAVRRRSQRFALLLRAVREEDPEAPLVEDVERVRPERKVAIPHTADHVAPRETRAGPARCATRTSSSDDSDPAPADAVAWWRRRP